VIYDGWKNSNQRENVKGENEKKVRCSQNPFEIIVTSDIIIDRDKIYVIRFLSRGIDEYRS
jgi:hypothetical protein